MLISILEARAGGHSAGYKKAADLLARRFLKNWQGNDVLTYPMVFLYRQCLELRLKEIIILGQRLLDAPIAVQQNILESHRIAELWAPCRKILEEIGEKGFWPKDPTEKLDSVEKLINEFHSKDPEAINFRYSNSALATSMAWAWRKTLLKL